MRQAGLLPVLTFAAAVATAQDVTAIVHAKLYTVASERPVENATIVLRGGVVESFGAGLAAPAGARVVDAKGGTVTPGLMAAGTQLGLLEIASLPETRDAAVASGPLGAAFDVQYALNPNSTPIELALSDGLTRAVTYPTGSGVVPFMGQGALLRLAPADAMLERTRVAMFAQPPGAAAAAGGSRGAAWQLLRNALQEARRFKPGPGVGSPRDQLIGRLDAEALQPVLAGRVPLAIVADRESDVREAVRLQGDERVKVMLYGGAEAWLVADELARADIPVVLDPTLNLAASMDSLGARIDNAALLRKAGVRVAFTVSPFHRTYNAGNGMRMAAGLAVANGLPWIEGLRAITSAPAQMFGLSARYGTVAPGKDADLVLWDGDPLEPSTSALAVWVRGIEQPLETRQKALAQRYSPVVQHDLPPAYR